MLISCKSSECKACLPTGEKSALRYPLAVRKKKGSWIHCWDLLTSCGEAVVAVMGLVDACRLLVRVIKSD